MQPRSKFNLLINGPQSEWQYQLKFVVVEGKSYWPLLGNTTIQAMINPEPVPQFHSTSSGGEKRAVPWTKRMEMFSVWKEAWTVNYALYNSVQEEFAKVQWSDIIAPVETSTSWVSTMLVVKKASGKVCICIVLKSLNQALKICHYPLPRTDELLPKGQNLYSLWGTKWIWAYKTPACLLRLQHHLDVGRCYQHCYIDNSSVAVMQRQKH